MRVVQQIIRICQGLNLGFFQQIECYITDIAEPYLSAQLQPHRHGNFVLPISKLWNALKSSCFN